MAEDLQDLKRKNHKQYKWIPKKGKYVFANVDSRGKIVKDKVGKYQKKKKDVAKNSFKDFKKKFNMSYQKVGERENKRAVQRAKDLFLKRRKEKFWDMDPPSAAGKAKGRQAGRRRGPVKRELRRPDEIFKLKKCRAKQQFKNMRKDKRRKLYKKAGGGKGKGKGKRKR